MALRQRHEHLFEAQAGLCLVFVRADALLEASSDHGESGAIDRLRDGGKLSDDVATVSTLGDHVENASKLPLGAPQALDDGLEVLGLQVNGGHWHSFVARGEIHRYRIEDTPTRTRTGRPFVPESVCARIGR